MSSLDSLTKEIKLHSEEAVSYLYVLLLSTSSLWEIALNLIWLLPEGIRQIVHQEVVSLII